MFGYVKVNKPEMKVKEYELYKGLYCSLCKAMGRHFGVFSRLTLSYDMTFFLLMRLCFSSSVPDFEGGRCPFNPAKRCNYCKNADEQLRYAAAVSVMMFFFKVKDNITDSPFFKKILMYLIFPWAFFKYKKAKKMYPKGADIIEKAMENQRINEKSLTDNTDLAAHESADALGKLLASGFSDEKGSIYSFGYAVGKFVYLCDAAEDIAEDIKTGSYNCFREKYKLTAAPDENIKKEIEATLNMCLAMTAQAFDEIESKTLEPIAENIIFDGMYNTVISILKGKKKK